MELIKRIKNLFTKHQKVPVPEYPQSIFLEPTNACNLRCRMCPAYGEGVQKSREVGFIKKELWMKAIDEIGSWPSHVHLAIHGAGEPLLHPNFFDIVSHAKSKNNITAGFFCNVTLLDEAKAKTAIELGVDWIFFSVDSAQKEIFEYHRKGAVLDTVEKNIRYFLSLRKTLGKPRISLNMVNHHGADVNMFIDKWSGLVDEIIIAWKRPVLREENPRLRLLKPCPLLYQQLVIGWPGKTGLCCEDFWGDFITGDILSESLYDIWHGKPLEKARKLHEAGKGDKLYLCRTCNPCLFHQYEEITIEKHGQKTIIRKELTDIIQELAVSKETNK